MGKKKEFIGKVVSDRMLKTIIVRVETIGKHPKYLKVVKKYNKFKVHDEKNTAKIGDLVKIEETRPLSKDKRFKLAEIVKKALSTHELKEDVEVIKKKEDAEVAKKEVQK